MNVLVEKLTPGQSGISDKKRNFCMSSNKMRVQYKNEIFESVSELARQLNTPYGTISSAMKRGGYKGHKIYRLGK